MLGQSIGKCTDDTKEIRQTWQTNPDLFQKLHSIFNFTIDGCAASYNALLPRFWSKEDSCLNHSWESERVFCNPPFGLTSSILQKGKEADLAVFLMPITGITTKYFHNSVSQYIIIPGRRIKYIPPIGSELKPNPSLGTVFSVFLKQDLTDDQMSKLKELSIQERWTITKII